MTRFTRIMISFVFTLLLTTTAISQTDSPFVRHPSLSPDGSRIAFSYQGDIWTADITGDSPGRITLHQAYETWPKWSRDGSRIAFSSDRYGSHDLYVVPAEGGHPERLTHLLTGDILTDWTPDNRLLFNTHRHFVQVEWIDQVNAVPLSGGTPIRVLDAVGEMASMSPNGRFIAFVHGACRLTREAYTGPANREIWLYDTEQDRYIQVTEFEGQDIYPNWGDDNTLYYSSAANGTYNLHRIALTDDGTPADDPERLTNYTEDGVRYFDISYDGSTVVFERQTDIYMVTTDQGTPRKIDIRIGTDYRFDPVEHKTFTGDIEDYALSPDGKYSAMVIRGELFVTANDKESERTMNLSRHAYRDKSPAWLNDSTLVYLSDREGQFDLYLVQSSDEETTNLYRTLKRETIRLTETGEDESSPVVSPDGNKIAFVRGRGQLIVADLTAARGLHNETVLVDSWDTPQGIAWSPDSRWLAYSLNDLNFNSEIYIHAADDSRKPANISMHPRGDRSPVWSADGSKLGFVSERNQQDTDIWFVWLKEEDWEKTKQDWEQMEELEDEQKKPDSKDAEGEEEPEPVEIDFTDIHERLKQVTSLAGDEASLAISRDGETFYFAAESKSGEGRDLYQIQWDGTEMTGLTTGGVNPSDVTLERPGKYLYYLQKGSLARIDPEAKEQESLPISAEMTINHTEEREQIFLEAWRTLRDYFYDPEFHGHDFTALRDKYLAWIHRASTKEDFRDLFNIMLGQLNASHMGMYGSDRAETQEEQTGLLGVEILPEEKGVRVVRVIPETPAEHTNSRLYPDDLITAVDGKPVISNVNFYSLLANTVDKQVILTVEGKRNQSREVVIRPTGRITDQLYDEWVEQHRRLTDEYSDGRLGYLHIRGMNWPSFERFEREFTAVASDKEGVVIDVRFNGGGWTTDYLMAVLNIDQHAYTIPRGATPNLAQTHEQFREHYPFAERLPFYPWTRPSIALCNSNSYSNAEIFSHAYKTLGIGKLVGEPTFGAVISTGAQDLIDGSLVRVPFRGWYVKATDKNMEHTPAVPDIIVQNALDSKAEDTDAQLQRAVEELLKDIDSEG